MELKLYMPVRLFVEENAVRSHSGELGRWGRRCLIVTGAASAKKSGALDDVTVALESQGVAWQLFDRVGQNPLLSVCHAGGQAAHAFGADFVVGIGGGSPLDAAKAVAVFAANPALPPMGLYGEWETPALPFLLVGTTAGTGSEVTRYSVLTVDETGQKRSWGSEQSYAQAAFGDPRYTWSLPMDFTLSTGLDGVAHALEAYFSQEADGMSDLFALEAMRLLLPVLKAVRSDSGLPDPEARARLYQGSIYGGLAINRTGTAFCHLMGYYLSEEAGVPHGFACAVFLPDLLRYAVPLLPDKARRLFRELGIYAAELCDIIAGLTTADFAPIGEEKLAQLLARWEGSKNMLRTPGDFTTEKQREIAVRILQKKGQ